MQNLAASVARTQRHLNTQASALTKPHASWKSFFFVLFCCFGQRLYYFGKLQLYAESNGTYNVNCKLDFTTSKLITYIDTMYKSVAIADDIVYTSKL